MKTKRIIAIIMMALMLLAVIPAASLAQGIAEQAEETRKLKKLDDAWENIMAVERQALATKASPVEVTLAAFNAAANEPLIDKGSLVWEGTEQFAFTVEGMHCAYCYRVRNSRHISNLPEVLEGLRTAPNGNHSTELDILLVGPYYGIDPSFTDQYREEAATLAAFTGGNLTKLETAAATGPAIAANSPGKSVIIYDSHGSQSGNSSYLCLTTNAGITSQDYSNGWAVNEGGGYAWIDGRYIENHITEPLANTFYWMAICEGMKRQGQGTTGYALIRAGAGAVYGYSQSVTFAGDYKYEATFWDAMMNGATASEALAAMIARWDIPDPHGDAYPILMSPVDPFPSNPDAAQTVNCDWCLAQPGDLVAVDAVGISFAESSYGVAPTFTLQLEPIVDPEGANYYTATWTSSDESVATVTKKGVVTGVNSGTATITCTIQSTQYSDSEYTYTASTEVKVSNAFLPEDVMYVPTNVIVPGETYLIGYVNGNKKVVMGNAYYSASQGKNFRPVSITTGEVAGVECITSDIAPAQEWFYAADGTFKNVAADKYLAITGNYLTLGDTGVVWTFTPTEGAKTGVLMNSVNSNYKYLGVNSSASQFGLFIASTEITLFRKLVRAASVQTCDLNGDGNVNNADALLIIRYAMGLAQLTPEQLALCDLNGDGEVNNADALLIIRYAMGL
ncbi:MAG: Ig-like domain-containing protein [Clostridiales bacterium]|nr:Ig-like domain-containing protein [Clostridiales bacterium]